MVMVALGRMVLVALVVVVLMVVLVDGIVVVVVTGVTGPVGLRRLDDGERHGRDAGPQNPFGTEIGSRRQQIA